MDHFEDSSINNVLDENNNISITIPNPITILNPMVIPNPISEKSKNFDYLETVSLLSIWSRSEIQESFTTNKKGHNKIWQQISQLLLEENNYSRTTLQCKNRVENLRRKYYELKKTKSGKGAESWPYYLSFNKVLGTTAIVEPVSILDALASSSAPGPSSTTTNDINALDEQENSGLPLDEEPENTTASVKTRGTKRKRRNDNSFDEEMLELLKKSQQDEEVFRKESKKQDEAFLDIFKGMLSGINSLVTLEKEKIDMKKNERYTLYGTE